ncbi:MAG: protein-L-isoaspartate(D-aspartate) O-methyltransferase [Pirellulales bacterium]
MSLQTEFSAARHKMVEQQLLHRGIRDRRVLEAMELVPREAFLQEVNPQLVYGDHACGIDCEQTISQPYMVALMSESLELAAGDRVLEIGTGSGYQTAILAQLAHEVYTVERHAPLTSRARAVLEQLGAGNVHYRTGDGTQGWPEAAPFDRILVTAGAEECPPALLEQLTEGGILVGPFDGAARQTLKKIRRAGNTFATANLTPCRFVPLIGSGES